MYVLQKYITECNIQKSISTFAILCPDTPIACQLLFPGGAGRIVKKRLGLLNFTWGSWKLCFGSPTVSNFSKLVSTPVYMALCYGITGQMQSSHYIHGIMLWRHWADVVITLYTWHYVMASLGRCSHHIKYMALCYGVTGQMQSSHYIHGIMLWRHWADVVITLYTWHYVMASLGRCSHHIIYMALCYGVTGQMQSSHYIHGIMLWRHWADVVITLYTWHYVMASLGRCSRQIHCFASYFAAWSCIRVICMKYIVH